MNSLPSSLPDGLRRQFAELETRLWRTDTIVAISASGVALLAAFALQLLSDRFWDTPAWLRVLLIGAALLVVAVSLIYYGRRWMWGHRSIEVLAAIVQKKYRRLGDRLLGIVELAEESRRPPNVSPQLCAAAINQVAGEAAKIDFGQAVETRSSRRLKTILIGLGILIAVPWLLAPEACWNALARLFAPAGAVQRYTFIGLGDLPDRLVVPHGEPFEIRVGIAHQRFLNPTRATARFEKQPVINAPIENNTAIFRVPGQTSPGVLRLRVGDAGREIEVVPTYRPELRELFARVQYPAYLRYPDANLPVNTASMTLVEGSRTAFAGIASRTLKSASATTAESEQASATVTGPQFETPVFDVDSVAGLTLSWVDEHGLAPSTPWSLKLEKRPDAPPEAVINDLPAAVAILETETLKVRAAASDDFGVRDLTMRWELEKSPPAPPEKAPAPTGDQRIARGEPQTTAVEGAWEFNPAALGIKGDAIVSVRATAIDYLPARERATSGAYRIYVLGTDSHAKLIHEQLDKILAELDDIARKQEELLASGKELDALDPKKLEAADSGSKLGDQSAAEKQLARQLDELAKKAAETLQEAMRNSDVNPSTLNKWADHIQAMQSLSLGMMPEASQQLANARQSTASRPKDLKNALDTEQKILDALRDLQKHASETQDQMAQQNIALRLRKLGDRHGEGADALSKLLPLTAGLSPEDLPAEPKKTLQSLSSEQGQRKTEAEAIHAEIQRFFDRSKLSKYGDVAKEMKDTAMDEKLAALAKMIADNTASSAIEQSQTWAKQFHDWADKIGAKDDSQQGEGEGKGKLSEEQMKVLLALMRLRQQEAALRTRTKLLESGKAHNEDYKKDTTAASSEQRQMMETAKEIGNDPAFCPGPQAMGIVVNAMNDAATHLEVPRTDEKTVDAETDVINLLDYLMQGQCSGSGNGAMAGMLSMLGMGKGAGGGGSMAGGDTDRENDAVTGSVEGETGAAKTASKTIGSDPSKVPAEFRDALQSYYQAIEKEAP